MCVDGILCSSSLFPSLSFSFSLTPSFQAIDQLTPKTKVQNIFQMGNISLTSSNGRLEMVFDLIKARAHTHTQPSTFNCKPTTLQSQPPPCTFPSHRLLSFHPKKKIEIWNTKNQFAEVKLSFGQHLNAILFDFESIYFILNLNRMLSFSLHRISVLCVHRTLSVHVLVLVRLGFASSFFFLFYFNLPIYFWSSKKNEAKKHHRKQKQKKKTFNNWNLFLVKMFNNCLL